MVSVFWDRKDILLVDCLPTINAAPYCDILTRLCWDIQNKRKGNVVKRHVPAPHNARPHSAQDTTALLEKFKWDILNHPPYSPDLAPSNSQLFLNLNHLAGKKFKVDGEVQDKVMTWFKGQAADFYDSEIQKLVPRLNKCLDNTSDCVEK